MAENAELDGDLFELLVNICLDRMNDRSYQVRAQAAKSSGRLQNTKDPDDLITKRSFPACPPSLIYVFHSLQV